MSALFDTLGTPWNSILAGAGTIVVVAAIGYAIMHYATRLIYRFLQGSSLDGATIVINLLRALVAVVATYYVGENVFHVELGGIAQALGVTTLVVSLGLQDLIKNVVAGVQIILAHLFSAGDQIEVGAVRGEVMDVNWRQTTLRDKDGDLHVVPNSTIMGGTFMRRMNKMARRYTISCDIKPGLNLERVAADIERLADEVLDERGWRAEEHTEVRFLGSTANGVEASIRIFLTDIEYTTRATDAVMRALGQRGYLADWTNESPAQERWR